jgi:hypothetical protein
MKARSMVILLSVVGTILACSMGSGGQADLQATAQYINNAVVATSTLVAQNTSDPNASAQAAAAQATSQAENIIATQAAQAALDEQQLSATATAFAPVAAELTQYGIDPSDGRPGWMHPPVNIEVEGYRQYDYANQFLNTIVEDFVISADITWNTQYGGSGCGFVLRSDGNEDAYNQYVAVITRGSSGHMLFGVMADGEVVNARDIYAYGIDPQFDWKNDTTNRLTVVGRGQTFTVYTNGVKLGDIDPSEPPPEPLIPPPPPPPPPGSGGMAAYIKAKAEYDNAVSKIRSNYHARLRMLQAADVVYDRGFVAMVALAESGRATCQFDNAWLWLLEN